MIVIYQETVIYNYIIFSLFFLIKRRARDHKEVHTTMNKYELALIVSAKIEDDVRVATVDKVKGYIESLNGTITNVDEWGKKRLAYEIQKMKEGFYYFIHFVSDSTVPAEVEQRIRIMDNVLRYLCVRQEAQKRGSYE